MFRALGWLCLFAMVGLPGCGLKNNSGNASAVTDVMVKEMGVISDGPFSGTSLSQIDWIGQKIFQNECAGQHRCLAHWNQGEAFPSLGIGHFIWYPAGVEGPFVESFPGLIRFMQARGVVIPDSLLQLDPFAAPWPDKAAFQKAEDSPQVDALRDFLARTAGIQAAYIFARAQGSFASILAVVAENDRSLLRSRLQALSETPGGAYALMDYVNFKGEGLVESERYQGQGWGLLQVLEEMDARQGQAPLAAFREAAAKVLTRRAANAENPIERQRWLPGWLKRLETYREPEPGEGAAL